MNGIDVNKLSPEERMSLFRQLSDENNRKKTADKEALMAIRADFVREVRERLEEYTRRGMEFKAWLRSSAEAYYNTLKEYGGLRRDDQLGFTVDDGSFRVLVKGCRVKRFDERADIAEKRLVEFLNGWIGKRSEGTRNPMYKLAMSMIQRNEIGDLDYKSISRLYELEGDFNDPEYSAIMELFRESNTVEGTSINFYFEKKDGYNNWRRIEPSFNQIRP